MKRPAALILILLVSCFLVANGVARLASPRRLSSFRVSEMSTLARSELGADVARQRQELIGDASLVAAMLEVVLAGLLLVGAWARPLSAGLMVLLAVFSVGLIVGAIFGWPVSACRCVAGVNNMTLRAHLAMNGSLIALLAVTRAWLWGGRSAA
jgi:hypothetical protein